MREPAFWSLALDEITDPDLTHVAVGVLPAHATADPAAWARFLSSRAALPWWLGGPLAVRDLVARLRGAARRPRYDTVRRIEGDEALVGLDARLWDLRLAVGVDEARALVRVVAAVRLKGSGAAWSGALRAVAPVVMGAMLARSRRELSGVTRG